MAGVLAAGVSRSHVIGFVGGKDTPAQRELLAAYQAGAHLGDSHVSVLERFAGDDADQVTAKRLAQDLMSSRADIIFAGTFVDSLGVIAGTSQARQLSIGLDRDEFDVAPNSVLTSVLKRTDVAAQEALSGYVNGWPSKAMPLGLSQGAVELAPFRTFGSRVSPEVRALLASTKQRLLDGSLTIPAS